MSVGDLDELLSQAGVPPDKRRACADDIHRLFDWYQSRLVLIEQQSEAGDAESWRQFAKVAKALSKMAASLPPGWRCEIDRDYRAFIEARSARSAVKRVELEKRDREAEPCEDVSMPENAWSALDRLHRKQSLLPVWPPLEHILAVHIETADRRCRELEPQVAREWSRRRRTFARNELALNIKAIGIGYSPKLAKNHREAEDWAAAVLRAAGIPCPYRETNRGAFERMFACPTPSKKTWRQLFELTPKALI